MRTAVRTWNFRPLVATGILILVLAGCSAPGARSASPSWQQVDASSRVVDSVEPGRAGIVVFRMSREGEGDTAGTPLNLYFNGDYHASLLPEARAIELSVCPGVGRLDVDVGGMRGDVRSHEGLGEAIELRAGAMHYYQVAFDTAGRPALRPVDAAQATGTVANLPRQAHTITRVVPETCAVQVAASEVIRLDSSALFEFGRHDRAGVLPEGRQALRNVVDKIGREYVRADRVVVKGYTDPVGSTASNLTLSQRRAQTVAALLTEAGLSANNIRSEGLGETSLLVSDCASRHRSKADINECNQPNRRVEIEIQGVKSAAPASE